MSFRLHPRVTPRIAELESAGGDCSDLFWILDRLRSGTAIPDRFRNHELQGKLKGLSSVIVGHTAEGRTVVMVYQRRQRSVSVAIVDEHDLAYTTLRMEKIAKRRKKA